MIQDELKEKARNFFLLGLIAERMGMRSEAASNYFKALFAVDDFAIMEKTRQIPKDHNERFALLKEFFPGLYEITDRLFSSYRRTYTKELSGDELTFVKKRIMEAFKNGGIDTPSNEEAYKRIAKLAKK